MARTGGNQQDVEPGILARIAAGIRGNAPQQGQPRTGPGVMPQTSYEIKGVSMAGWFTPGQPMRPVAQEEAAGRAFDFPVAINMVPRPRSGEAGVTFEHLRGLADGYDLLRLAIETRKDQVEAFEFEVLPEDEGVKPAAVQDQIDAAYALLKRPDGKTRWSQWLRMLVEELLVIDAVAVYPRANRGGGLYGLELVDGATIKRLIDDGGRTPIPPDPAYQQIIKGVPAVLYTTDQLVYWRRNPRVSRMYGCSPVEQVITTINIALRRQQTHLSHYTEGSVPDGLAQVPATWTAKQIADFQVWFDSVTNGPGPKSRIKFIPSLDNIVFPRLDAVKDAMDDWLARIICFAFSISPSALLPQVNRASGEQMADTAKEEGLIPILRALQHFLTDLLQQQAGLQGVRFAWKIVNRVDPKTQMEVHTGYLAAEVLTPDEIRAELDRAPLTPEQREEAFPAPPPPPAFLPGQPPQGAQQGQPPGQDAPKDGPKPNAEPAEETPAEKMLASALAMLDPERIAAILAKGAEAQAPRVVEVRPEVNVEVGDTNIHMPAGRASA